MDNNYCVLITYPNGDHEIAQANVTEAMAIGYASGVDRLTDVTGKTAEVLQFGVRNPKPEGEEGYAGQNKKREDEILARKLCV